MTLDVAVNIRSRGLNYEENLLWDKARSDEPGVDLPVPEGLRLRTGADARGEIGLPQVSEPQVLRHFVRLSTMNYSIDSGFFPLGSCTMKHNPRLNEKLARLPGFANLHPMQPESTVQGALEVMYTLQQYLGELTGLPGVCLAPAAGAHGELAGMMTIRRAHEARGEVQRDTVLIPDSAHGTNPATAAICGYKVKTIVTKETGRLTLEAFREALGDGVNVAGMMVTNPNTCGLFEGRIVEIAGLLHAAGGYFYCDGANFNALVGKIRPADFGVDVMHINLHKTFSTPHGGGGPGSGPICVTEALAPFMPVPVVEKTGERYRLQTEDDRPETLGRLKGFHGQFGMHVRALAYIMSHGNDGLLQVAEDAVLNANYIMSQLKEDFHVPFEGPCMHECLLTDKAQKEAGVTTLDIAKTLVEYSFHPMTVYFPLVVQGAMLIEPTETESQDSLDRFIVAMKSIAEDVRAGDSGRFHDFPVSTPRRRLDEVRAAKEPKLRWKR
ncbi:MAG: glycine dehydrogenase subunit 2 [Alphaproteobacteria bacterium]|nr:glycine dehydrogenase subunit 2 [Alphaproteobacteria bacterium]